MGKIVITTNTSLDGIVEDPDGQEGSPLGGWFGQFGGKDLEVWTKVETEEALGAEALLLGRRSDEWFATRWLSRTGEWAELGVVEQNLLQPPTWEHGDSLPMNGTQSLRKAYGRIAWRF